MRPQEPVTRAFFATKSSLTQGTDRRLHSYVAIITVLLISALCLFNWFETFAAVTGLYLAIPFFDYWRVASHVREIQSFDFRYLWQQHNEHRIVFPDLVFAADVLLFHMRRILPIVASCLAYLVSWLLLVYPAARDSRLKLTDRILIVALAGAVVGWRGVALSLADPFLLQWSLMSVAALLSLSFLPVRSNLYLGFAIVCAVVATYSCGGGLLLWPVLWICGRLLKLTRRRYLALVVSGSLSIAAYFIGYRFADANAIGNLLHHPFYTLGFWAMYISMPFGGMKSAHFGLYIGAAALCLFLLLSRFLPKSGSRVGMVAGSWYLFLLLSALTIAASRMDSTDTTFTAAKPFRYLVPVMLGWGALFTMLLWISAIRRWRIASPVVLTLVLAALLLISNRKLSWWWTINLRPYTAAQITEVSLENQIFDPELVRQIFPRADFVAHYLPELRQSHLSIYANAPVLGTTLVSSSTRPVEITRQIPLSSGLEVIGRTPTQVKRVFLIGPANMIIGTGRSFSFGLPTELMPRDTRPSRAWIAFIPPRFLQKPFFAGRTAAPFAAVAR